MTDIAAGFAQGIMIGFAILSLALLADELAQLPIFVRAFNLIRDAFEWIIRHLTRTRRR